MTSEDLSTHFGLANIPFATRLGNIILFIPSLLSAGLLSLDPKIEATLSSTTTSLNTFAALGRPAHRIVRDKLRNLLLASTTSAAVKEYGEHASAVTMHLPVVPRDFTDFLCCEDHLQNSYEAMTGKGFVPPAFYRYPFGYGGRASSIIVSGESPTRPRGQYKAAGAYDELVIFAPTAEMDFELEVGIVIGKPVPYGNAISAIKAEDHIFGLVLVNDWSARDIQAFEMQLPLGALTSKAYATQMSPWIITMDALEAARTAPLHSRNADIPPSPDYLQLPADAKRHDIELQAQVTRNGQTTVACKTNIQCMYWTFSQLVAQQSISCCGLAAGDLLATGTASGKGVDGRGCLLESNWKCKTPLVWADGTQGGFLEDKDIVQLFAKTKIEGVGFGECRGQVKPYEDSAL